MLRPFIDLIRALLRYTAAVVAVLAVIALAAGFRYKDKLWAFDPKPGSAATTTSSPTPAGPLAETPTEACPAGYDRDKQFGDFPAALVDAVKAQAAGVDGWTGLPLTPTDRPQIDHVVAVHEAYCSGLDPALYRQFNNDPANLLLTRGSLNESKGDKEPGQWKAPTVDAECRFVTKWIAVKATYRLTMDRSEAARVASLRASCQAKGLM